MYLLDRPPGALIQFLVLFSSSQSGCSFEGTFFIERGAHFKIVNYATINFRRWDTVQLTNPAHLFIASTHSKFVKRLRPG